MLLSVWLLVTVSEHDVKKSSADAESTGLSYYKVPDNRCTAFGGVMRDEEGEIVDAAAAAAAESLVMRDNSLPIDYVVITELSELFERAVSSCFFFTISFAVSCVPTLISAV